MKRTFSVSISGRIFNIEEDAYALLLEYLSSLSQVFKGAEGQEIVSDIEGRICEIFSEKQQGGLLVVTRAEVDYVIATVGSPKDIAGGEADDPDETAGPRHAGAQTPPPAPVSVPKKFYRCSTDRVLGGVVSGLCLYAGWNTNLVRILLLLIGFISGFFPLFVIYCVLWIALPLAKTPEQQLEQLGQAPTVDNIGSIVMTDNMRRQNSTTPLQILGNLFMGIVGIISASVGAAMAVAIIVLAGMGLVMVTRGSVSLFSTGVMGHNIMETGAWLGCVSICIAVLVPCIAMVWAACSVIFKTRGASTITWIIGGVCEVAAIITAVIACAIAC